ncbi:MAG: ring-cleaving dioxygenase [Acidobacteriota bacterium]
MGTSRRILPVPQMGGADGAGSVTVAPLLGLHHVTALCGDARSNIEFYTRTLGMRLVKRTVNYDDPGTYHFYFGDGDGRLGSLLTFFPWGRVVKPRKGSGQIVGVAFAVSPTAVKADGIRFEQPVQTILDPEGMAVEMIGVAGAAAMKAERLHSVTLLAADLAAVETLLGETLGLVRAGVEGNRVRYAVGRDQFLDILHDGSAEPGVMGAGIIHHVALRVADEAEQMAWRERLVQAGLRVSPVKDRSYFHSVYFRKPGAPLFEIATEGPGLTLDESLDSLGQRLCLPKWLEPHRGEIEAQLPALEIA